VKEEKRFTSIIPKSVERYLTKIRNGNEYLDYGREIIVKMAGVYIESADVKQEEIKILDIGAGSGADLHNIQCCYKKISQLYAIETNDQNIENCKVLGVIGYNLDIEKKRLPFEDGSIDIVIANQIIEHTKELFFIFSEISRVLKENGVAIIGFPNLAALHNRILLLLGEQPICIRLPGPHVRGITKGAFRQFITTDGYFTVEKIAGSNFFSFSPKLAGILAKAFPSASISLFFCCRRTKKKGTFINVLNSRFYETNFFTGPGM